jgi:hypothetical protein
MSLWNAWTFRSIPLQWVYPSPSYWTPFTTGHSHTLPLYVSCASSSQEGTIEDQIAHYIAAEWMMPGLLLTLQAVTLVAWSRQHPPFRCRHSFVSMSAVMHHRQKRTVRQRFRKQSSSRRLYRVSSYHRSNRREVRSPP